MFSRHAATMLRTAATYVVVGLYSAIAGPLAVVLAAWLENPRAVLVPGMFGVRLGLALAGIRTRVIGLENLEPGPAVYCINHTSNLDLAVFSILYSVRPQVRILYKKEIDKLPLVGHAFRGAGFIAIDRRDLEESKRAFRKAVAAIQGGCSFLVAPEGTRSRSGELGPFKKGIFIMAIEAQAPIVPIAVHGGRDAMRKGSPLIWPVTLSVRVGNSIATRGLTFGDRERLSDHVRERLQTLLAQDPI